MMLTDAGVPLAAYDGVEILAEYSAEPTLLWMCRTLQEGTGCALTGVSRRARRL